MPKDTDLELRGRLIRSLGSLRDMLPGSFVERKRACGRPNCHCADGKTLHAQYRISVLVEGKPKAFNAPATLVEQVRKQLFRSTLVDLPWAGVLRCVSAVFQLSLPVPTPVQLAPIPLTWITRAKSATTQMGDGTLRNHWTIKQKHSILFQRMLYSCSADMNC